MSKKYKLLLLIIGILIIITMCVGSSYALWMYSASQEGTNLVNSDCFEITFEGDNNINLINAFPISDSEGVYLKPYTFTITNICNHSADFQINLETLSSSTVSENFIRFDLNGYINDYSNVDSVTPTVNNAKSAAMLYEDTLKEDTNKTYNLRLWIKESATQVDVGNKTYLSKVSVRSTIRKNYSEGKLVSGLEFINIIRGLAGETNISFGEVNSNIKHVRMSDTAPVEGNNAVNVAADNSSTPIYTWFDNIDTIYLYSQLDKIYMNEDSAGMFYGLKAAKDIDLSHFDTSKVEDMSYMFTEDSNLTSIDVSNFDTSNVKNMHMMFAGMTSLTSLDVSNFNTSNVESMSQMFAEMSNLTSLNLSHFNTKNVTDMGMMFYNMTNLENLNVSSFDTSKVTNMAYMFGYCTNLQDIDVSNFDTSNVEDFQWMFSYTNSITSLDLNNISTKSAKNIGSMFRGMKNLTALNIGKKFDTSNVEIIGGIFDECQSIEELDLSNFDTTKVTTMENMFSKMTSLKKITFGDNFNTSNVTSMEYMFANDQNLTELDLSKFDTSKVTTMKNMFNENRKLETIYVSNKWNTAKLNDYSMFYNCLNIVGGAGTTYSSSHISNSYAHVDGGQSNPGYLTLKTT